MEANSGSSRCTQLTDFADEGRSLIDALDLADVRKNTTEGFPLRRGLTESFRSTLELTTLEQPCSKDGLTPPVPPVLTTADIDDQWDTLKCLQQHLSMIDALDLAVDRRIAATVGPQLRPLRANSVIFRSSAELSIHSPVYGPVKSVPLVAYSVLTTVETGDQTDTVKCLQQHYGLAMIDALDLAVDSRIATTAGSQLRPLRENAVIFRSSAELSIHSPMYGPVKSAVQPVAAEIQHARCDRRRSLYGRGRQDSCGNPWSTFHAEYASARVLLTWSDIRKVRPHPLPP